MKALPNSPIGAGGSLTIHALLNPIYQFASSPPSENLPKSLILGDSATYVGSTVPVETVDNVLKAPTDAGNNINAEIKLIIIF
jgi:hypothetical protein